MKKRFLYCVLVIFVAMASVSPRAKATGLADSGWLSAMGDHTLYLRSEDKTILYGTVHLSRSGTGDYRYPCTSFTPQGRRQVQIYAGSSANAYTTYRSSYSTAVKVIKYDCPISYTSKNYGRVYVVK